MVSATTSPGLPLTTADAFHPRKYDWNPRHIRWGDVLRYQHWGGLLILIPAVVITGMHLLTLTGISMQLANKQQLAIQQPR
jgi:hypothetical protein